MMIKHIIIIVLAFMVGIVSTIGVSNVFASSNQPVTTTTYVVSNNDNDEDSSFVTRILGIKNEEKPSPFNWIPERDISVQKDKVIIEIKNAQWSKFTNTNSMDPVLDNGANAIQIVPSSETDIHIGDIVSYQSKYAEGTIIHRVIEIGYDKEGWYVIMKGDNNPRQDPGKVRFSQIKRVLVAIIY